MNFLRLIHLPVDGFQDSISPEKYYSTKVEMLASVAERARRDTVDGLRNSMKESWCEIRWVCATLGESLARKFCRFARL